MSRRRGRYRRLRKHLRRGWFHVSTADHYAVGVGEYVHSYVDGVGVDPLLLIVRIEKDGAAVCTVDSSMVPSYCGITLEPKHA